MSAACDHDRTYRTLNNETVCYRCGELLVEGVEHG